MESLTYLKSILIGIFQGFTEFLPVSSSGHVMLLSEIFGCTRPVFDRGILPYKLVIGQSGVVVKPKIYIAFGVSGAVNHVTAVTDSDKIIAVNKDPDAAIFNYCDYGIVGDMEEVCDMMIAKLKNKS